jgi:hypothetical protein
MATTCVLVVQETSASFFLLEWSVEIRSIEWMKLNTKHKGLKTRWIIETANYNNTKESMNGIYKSSWTALTEKKI